MNVAVGAAPSSPAEDPPKFVIPQMLAGIEPRINTHYPLIRGLHAKWLYGNYGQPEPGRLHGAVERMDSLYDALVFPDGLPERVAHHACMLTMIFQCDDLSISDPELCEKIVADDPDAHDARVLDELWRTIRRHAPGDSVYRRLRDRWTRWMRHLQVENRFRDNWIDEDWESFLSVRLMSSGMQAYIAAIEYVHDIDVSDVVDDPEIRRAVDLVGWHCAITNDVYSYAAEYATVDSVNAVGLMRRLHGYDAQQAVDTVCRMLEDMYQELDERIARLHSRYARHRLGERLHQYLDNYPLMVAGTLQWHMESPRYGGRGHIWNGLPMRRVDAGLARGEKMAGAGAPRAHDAGTVYVT